MMFGLRDPLRGADLPNPTFPTLIALAFDSHDRTSPKPLTALSYEIAI